MKCRSILPKAKTHCRKKQIKTNSWQECTASENLIESSCSIPTCPCPLQRPHQHRTLPLLQKDALYLPPPYERAYAHPSSLTGRSNSCRGIRPCKDETLGACKPLRAQCPEEDLFSQWGPARLFPASSVFYYPSPGITPLYSRPLWEKKSPWTETDPPLRTHAPPDLLRLSLYLHRQFTHYSPKNCSMEEKKAKHVHVDKTVMCTNVFYELMLSENMKWWALQTTPGHLFLNSFRLHKVA